MIAALSPASDSYEETLSTLIYANRAKQIKNKPKINEDPKDALLREYEDEIKQLKDMISQMAKGGADPEMLKLLMAKQSQLANNHVEESADALMAKLQGMGKNIKFLDDGHQIGAASGLQASGAGDMSFKKQLEQIEKIEQDKEAMKDELNAKEEMLKAEQDQKVMMEELLA